MLLTDFNNLYARSYMTPPQNHVSVKELGINIHAHIGQIRIFVAIQ